MEKGTRVKVHVCYETALASWIPNSAGMKENVGMTDDTAHGNEDVSGSTTGNILNSQSSIINHPQGEQS